ncbi:hypothetical protein Misp02_07130 [Microtetraspora sp. NBRC 16547]|nr:hypothetical protein Misp02_07130 [Microtetraspora sp. NBRC 16547]
MTGQAIRTDSAPRIEKVPESIWSALPRDLKDRFLSEYRQGLREAGESLRLDPVNEIIEKWWRRAVLANHRLSAETMDVVHRLRAGEEVDTVPADLDELRRRT